MRGLLALVIASTMLALPSLAEGSTVGLDGEGAFVIEAEPGEENDVYVGATKAGLYVLDEAGTTAVGDGCEHFTQPDGVGCPYPGPGESLVIEADLGDRNDKFASYVGFPVDVRGGPGQDRLQAGPDGSILRGGHGADVLGAQLYAGDLTLLGGPGADQLSGWRGDDSLHGGPGADREEGGHGDDILGGPGDLGRDYFRGQAHSDRIDARDGIADLLISCGSVNDDDDWARRDRRLDPEALGCEDLG